MHMVADDVVMADNGIAMHDGIGANHGPFRQDDIGADVAARADDYVVIICSVTRP